MPIWHQLVSVSLLRSEDAGVFGKSIFEVLNFAFRHRTETVNSHSKGTPNQGHVKVSNPDFLAKLCVCVFVSLFVCVDVLFLCLADLRLIKLRVASSNKAATRTWRRPVKLLFGGSCFLCSEQARQTSIYRKNRIQ